MYESGDLILFTLSAWKETRWAAFKKTFDELYGRRAGQEWLADERSVPYERWRAVRLLAALGHCDVDFSAGAGKIFVAPAVIVRLPIADLPRAVLCGARSPRTLQVVRQASSDPRRNLRVRVESQAARSPFSPCRVEIEASSDGDFQTLASNLQILYSPIPPAWTIAKLVGRLEDYAGSLKWSSEPELNWEREDFHPERLQFTKQRIDRTAFRLSRYQDPVRLRWIYRLRREGMDADVDPLWGRYAVLGSVSRPVILYDQQIGNVAIPRGAPLPLLCARILSLCSGYAPRFVPRAAIRADSNEQFGFDVYDAIPLDVLKVVLSKIGQAGFGRIVSEGRGG